MRRIVFLIAFVAALVATNMSPIRSAAGAAHAAAAAVASGIRELTAREQAEHVLNRLAFGPRPGEVDRVMRIGVDKWMDQQLHPQRMPDKDVDRLMSAYPSLSKSADELIRDYPPPQLLRARLGDGMSRRDSIELRRQAQQSRQFAGDILSAKVARAVVSEDQLQEVMTDFWENHFTVFIGKGQQIRYFIPDYDRETIRPHALGHFRDLLEAVAKSPAMLFYLDNAQSVADSGRPTLGSRGNGRSMRGGRFNPRRPGIGARPALAQQLQQRRPRGINENYARELLELHTLGVDGGYTQQDVIEVARALTGWSIEPPRSGRAGFLFRSEAHDAGEKLVLGHRLRAGRGLEDGEDVLDIVARHPSTARFIARKLCFRFVSDTPPAAVVERAAMTFTRTNGDIREVVRTIVTSPEFFSRAAFRAKVKSPFEVTVSALRALGAQPDTTPRTAAVVAYLGQPLFGHQAPNGWPETGEAWMNTGAILNRINFGLAMAAGRLPGAPLSAWPLYEDLTRATRADQVDSVIAALLGGHASAETREILLSGNNPLLAKAAADTTMTFRDDTLTGNDMDQPDRSASPRRPLRPGQVGRGGGPAFGQIPPLSGLAQVVGLALGSPEFQRR